MKDNIVIEQFPGLDFSHYNDAQRLEMVTTEYTEVAEMEECPIDIRNVGWTLGNACPYTCKHCYSLTAREKGMDLSVEIIDRIVNELATNGVETVNLGGNEPIYTNGLNPKKSLLPYIIKSLSDRGIRVGLTTSGITLMKLKELFPETLGLINDIDISFDSPRKNEHNDNRGADLYDSAVECLRMCQEMGIDHTMIMCGMNWNFTPEKLRELMKIAKETGSNVRINPIKPVSAEHMNLILSPEQFYEGFQLLLELGNPIDLGEPPIATVSDYENAKGCPCGRTSFRIHSITPDGKIPVSPCVYGHDFKAGDLTTDSLRAIVTSPQFKLYRIRNAHPELVEGCTDCELIVQCRGGCTTRSYLHNLHETGNRDIFAQDPYCPVKNGAMEKYDFPQNPVLVEDMTLVHKDYLCTIIVKPK